MTARKDSWGVRASLAPKSTVESGPARELHPERVHERGDELDRWADANAAVAGSVRRAFIGRVR